MQKISQVKPLLLPNLIKTGKNEIPLKTIKRPKVGKPLPKKKDEIKERFELNEDSTWSGKNIKLQLRLVNLCKQI